MKKLPHGWVSTALGDVTQPTQERVVPTSQDERRYLGLEHVQAETTKIVGSSPASELRSGTMRFDAGDTLYGRLRPYLNKVCLPTFGGLASSEFMVFKNDPALAPGFLLYLLNSSEFVRFASLVNDGDRPRVKWNQMRAFPVDLPPYAEQRRIVAAIEEQFSRLEHAVLVLQRARANLAKLEQQIFAAAFEGAWEWTTLGEIADLVGGITKDSKNQGRPGLVEVPYLRVANVQRGRLDLAEVTTIRVTPDKLALLALQPGDVLFNEGGDRDKLGRGWIWEGQLDPCIHQNHVFRARLHDGFDPRFVSWHGNTFGQKWFWDNGKQTTNLASLSLSTLKRFPVPSPPLDEQRRIVGDVDRQLSLGSAMRTEIDLALGRSASLRRAILSAAFAGGLADPPALRAEDVAS